MTTRDLFNKKTPYKVLSSKTLEKVSEAVESADNINQRLEEKNRFIPVVNFDYPQNFARYGKAEEYYRNSITRIQDDYPYDGSLKEKTEFRNQSSYLDLYLLDNKYPRTTGHAIFSPNGWGTVTATIPIFPSGYIGLSDNPEYVYIKGGPNQAPQEYLSKSLREQFEKANKYDPDLNRQSNLRMDFEEGITVEFWMDKSELMNTSSYPLAGTSVEIPFMVSNQASGSFAVLMNTVDTSPTGAPFSILATSGSAFAVVAIPSIVNSDYLANGWHHFAFSAKSTGSSLSISAYLDGDLKGTYDAGPGTSMGEVTGTINATLGAGTVLTYPSIGLTFPSDGYGKVSGSIDEFRYWKTERTPEEIGRFWFTQYGGGTNTDISNTDLGVYYKFNEGIVGNSTIDSTVLDYSGRISNGSWTGYSANSRLTSSAIDTYLGKVSEFKDPIIYSNHPDVISVTNELISLGSDYDITNNSSIYNSIPSWITEEDELAGQDLLKLTQILSSYFDSLHMQIEAMPRLKDKVYNDPSIIKPTTFSSRLLESQGFVAPEIFAEADVLAQILKRDADRKYELDLYDIKNVIYQNVYNNIVNIYKSKGTEKSFRNLIRCFGVDEELIRLNIYGNNVEYQIKDNYNQRSVKKNYADFNHPDRFASTVYQQTASSDLNTTSYISGSSLAEYLPFTVECEVIFPKKIDKNNSNYFETPFVTSSLFGFHGADDLSDFTWPALPANDANLQVYAVREERESQNVYFRLLNRDASIDITTQMFEEVYDNKKWNISVRVRPEQYHADLVSGSATGNLVLEFTGLNSEAGIIDEQFYYTASIPSTILTTGGKRLYAGAYRTNFTGSVIEQTDVKVSSVRYWASYLSDDSLNTHAVDPSNHGSLSPYESTYLWPISINGTYVPQEETLALNWNFDNVISSDSGISGIPTISDAGYYVADISSGSLDLTSRYGWLGNILKYQHTGRGDFYIPNDTKVIDVKYIYSNKLVGPEVIQSSDMINILGESDIYFDRDSRPTNYFYAIEKSMYQTISDEMLKMFSTIKDFSNLIGDPVNRYRQNYKSMEKLRHLFFENVENTPSLDKYIDFYKWLDSSLNEMIQQLVPMSADVSDEIRNMIESHVLERNKYQSKFPTLESAPRNPNAGIQGVNRLLYNWKYDHHPVSDLQNENCAWWKIRADRTNPVISSGNPSVDEGRQKILDVKLNALNRGYSTPLRLNAGLEKAIKGGNNTRNVKGIDITRNNLSFGTTDGVRVSNIESAKDCTDILDPNEKNYITIWAKNVPNQEYLNSYSKNLMPFESRYSDATLAYAGAGTSPINLHKDVYGPDAETPMQGPFTNEHVGGLGFRHAPINDGTDTSDNRAEGWNYDVAGGLRFIYPDVDKPRSMYYRDETAKRPLNIKNIRGAYGNFTKNWEVVQSAGRTMNNKAWVVSGGWDLQPVGTPSYWVSGLEDIPKISRGRNESVIVSRFSSPGGPETMGDSNGGPGLDYLSAEFSFNNDLNSRNWNVRSVHDLFLTSHVNQFGFFSNDGGLIDAGSSSVNPLDYSGTGSIYQVNRNTLRRLELSGTSTIWTITASQNDNFWIQHSIPRSDLNYSWVNKSYVTVDPSALGYWHEGLFDYTARVVPIYQENFTSSLGGEWSTSGEISLRKSEDSDNWVVRFGDWTAAGLGSDRILELTQDIELPMQISYEYARGNFQNKSSRVFMTFGENVNGAYTVLSGSGDRVDTWSPSAPAGGANDMFTISFWFRPASSNPANQQYLFSWDDTTSNNAPARLFITPTEIGFYQQYTTGNLFMRALHTHDSSSWTHVALTHDVGSALVGNLPTLYINGVSASLNVQSNTVTATPAKSFESFIIGGRDPYNTAGAGNDYPAYCYTGSIDNIYWHADILDASQIAELYNNGTPPSVNSLSFFESENTDKNYPNHYLQTGDAQNDEGGTVYDITDPSPQEKIFDYGTIDFVYKLNFVPLQDSAYAPLDNNLFLIEEYPGYNMTAPDVSAGEVLKLEYSTDGGLSWQSARTLDDDDAFEGSDVGFITRTTNLYASPTETSARIRFIQTGYSNAKRDNWALNSLQIDRTIITDPITFSPYSDFVSRWYTPNQNLLFGADSAQIEADSNLEFGIPTTFNGLNYNIYEPIVDNISLGFGRDYNTSSSLEYINEDLMRTGSGAASFPFPNPPALYTSQAALLNAILLKRNGPYGYPIFKQIRTGEHAIARNLRKNNYIASTQTPGNRIELNGQQYIEKYGNTTICREPVVNSSFGTLDYLLGFRVATKTKGKNTEYLVRPVQIKTTYGNNLGYFSSNILNVTADYDKTGLSSQPQAYDTIKSLYLDGALNDVNSPVYSLVSLKYSEKIYPAALNSYSGVNRKRTGYTEGFWKNSIADRVILGNRKFYNNRRNSANIYVGKQSAWALDANSWFTYQVSPTASSEMTGSLSVGICNPIADKSRSNVGVLSEDVSGELQNGYVFCWQHYESDPGAGGLLGRSSKDVKPAAIYARKQDVHSYYSVVNPNGMEFINANITSSNYLNDFELSLSSTVNPTGPGLYDGDTIGWINSAVGNAKFETPHFAGKIVNNQFVSQSQNPFDNDYDDYNIEMILKNKEYSIVPEFKISDHMKFYFEEKGRDFLTDNPSQFNIGGTDLSSSLDGFYTTYSYSDFMKYFEVVDSDHSKIDDLNKTLTLKCSAIKKLLPYDGFYPSERTLQIANLFQESYYTYMSESIPARGTGGAYRPVISAFTSPGILYNTIKSGIAVDYPIYTSSFHVVNYVASSSAGTSPTSYYALGSGSQGHKGWDYRVPFEALLSPEIVNGIDFYDMEPNPESKLEAKGGADRSATALVAPVDDNLYKRAVSNFLAETTDFFLDNGLSTFVSDVDDGGYYFESGSYGMRIRLRRSMNKQRVSGISFPVPQDSPQDEGLYETITMYSRPTAFGPPVAGSDVFFITASESDSGLERWQNSDSLYGKNPSFTPPYYDGECWYDIVYSTDQAKTLTLDELFQEATFKQTRIQPNTTVWPNNEPTGGSATTGSYPMTKNHANNFAMKLDSCIFPFAKTFEQSKKDPTQKSARWTIQTKFETPVLNFSDKTLRPLTLDNIELPVNLTGTVVGDFGTLLPCEAAALYSYGGQTATPIGMWHQFGLIPQGDEGIHLSISDIDIAYLTNVNDPAGFYANRGDMKSMIDAVGFKKNDSRKIGSLAQQKTVSEAVVAIPYVITNGKRRFFEIDRGMIDYAEDTINDAQAFRSTGIPCGDSIIDMVRKINKFVIPPRFDFVKNNNITPFAMYIFDFKHTFNQDDLSYIWQNIAPPTGRQVEEVTAEISHKIIDTELLEKMKDRVRWIVFKAKQRGNNNYFSTLAGQAEEKSKQFDYSYNWPYDNFSLIEFVKMTSQVEYSTDKAIDMNESGADSSKELLKGLRSTKPLNKTMEENRLATSGLTKEETKERTKEKRRRKQDKKRLGAFKTEPGDKS